jgi:predicted ATPase/class 3 adenylate cyclase
VARRDLPAGTVTFLFTDVEGSTRLLDELGTDAYGELLAEHHRVCREVWAAHEAVEVDTAGDAFFVVFARASAALAAAGTAQEALRAGPLRVRIGVHTGEAAVTETGYVGMEVHRAARIAAAAHGGQVVVSASTRALVGDGFPLVDLGEHRFKDMSAPERVFQLGDGEFPPLKTLDATNLPLAASPLVGRQREVDELVALASNGTRLLTVTGPGGTGKTRLALQVAAELVGAFRDGVFWVPLAGLSDPELVFSELGQAIGSLDDLTGFLRGKELLMVLDNFEHLLDAAPAVSALLSASGRLRVLVTSRSPLRVSGEREYRLGPLSSSDAAVLFVERAGAFGRELEPDAMIEAICRRLDGLPLAVELAAARTKVLAPALLLDRLDSALPLLTGGARDAPERQRTLRATIAWSYDLLDAPNRELLERLSIFSGSFPLAAAEVVCDADLDRLEELVDSSLLKPIGDDRFLMLGTIREFALERLECSNGAEALRERHATFFSVLAEQAYEHRFDAEAESSGQLDIDHDDLRAAFDWLATADPERALGLAGALGWFWLTHGHLAEGRQRLAAALARSTATGAPRARALTALGAITARCGDVDDGRGLLTEAIGLWRDLADQGELASALDALGWLLVDDADDAPGALEMFEQSLGLGRERADRSGETRALVGVCQVLVALGDVGRAESLSRDLLDAAGGDPRTEHFAYHFLADCALIRGDVDEAESRYRESLRAAISIGDVIETSYEVQGVAMASAGRGDAQRALRLAASVEALWESLGATGGSVSFWDELLEKFIGGARETLGADAHAVWAEGRALRFDDAVSRALTSPEA